MRKFLILALMLFKIIAYAQSSKVPANVVAAFKTQYPNAEDVEWQITESTYEASFFDPDTGIGTAIFDRKAVWIESSFMITEDQLPEPVMSIIQTKMQPIEYAYIESATVIVNSKDEFYYQCVVQLEELILYKFDINGTILKEEVVDTGEHQNQD